VSGTYLRTGTRWTGYRPPYQLVPEAFDHQHRLDYYLTEDDHEIVYCTVCSQEW
jgi:hypothetical protein